MKTINSTSTRIWEKTKRTFYALYLVATIAAVPVLGFIEWSHGDTKPEQNAAETINVDDVSANHQITTLKLDFRAI